MRCKHCGAPTRVLDTRTDADGYVLVRRRRCERNPHHVFRTYEVDDGLRGSVVRLATNERRAQAADRRAALVQRNEAIMAELRAGAQVKDVAARFALSESMVSTIAYRAGYSVRYRRPLDKRKRAVNHSPAWAAAILPP